jgi:acetate kinase
MGNGASIAAIQKGKVLDTTMGLTPLPGMIMGTRSGDIDPALIFFLARKGYSIDDLDDILNKKSGLSAINGLEKNGKLNGDMRDTVHAAEMGKAAAINAINMFAHRAALYIGGYYTLLSGADAIIFTGGIGENSHPARKSIITRLEALGCKLDEKSNEGCFGVQQLISTADSKTPVVVIPTNEELMIARDTYKLLVDTALEAKKNKK